MSNYKFKLKNVRLSFPSIFKRSEFNGQEGKFEATFLINKEQQKDLIKEIEAKIALIQKIKSVLKTVILWIMTVMKVICLLKPVLIAAQLL